MFTVKEIHAHACADAMANLITDDEDEDEDLRFLPRFYVNFYLMVLNSSLPGPN